MSAPCVMLARVWAPRSPGWTAPGALRVVIAVYPGVDDLDVFGPLEVFDDARRSGAPVAVTLAATESGRLPTSHGATLLVERTLVTAEADLLVVPGGGWNDRSPQGAYAEVQRGVLPALIGTLHGRGVRIASVCTGAGIVAAAGILRGRPVSTHRAARREVGAEGVQMLDARVVDDGDVLSCGGVTAGIDLALHVVERRFGGGLGDTIAAELEYARQGPVVYGPRGRPDDGPLAARP